MSRDRLNLGGIGNLMITDDDLINKKILHVVIKTMDHCSGPVLVGFGQRVRIGDDKHGKGQGFHNVDGLLTKTFIHQQPVDIAGHGESEGFQLLSVWLAIGSLIFFKVFIL